MSLLSAKIRNKSTPNGISLQQKIIHGASNTNNSFDKPGYKTLLALAIVTASTLALQVILTRLFSSALAYHYSFLAISLSLLGTGAGALTIYIFPNWFQGSSTDRMLSLWTGVFAVLLFYSKFS